MALLAEHLDTMHAGPGDSVGTTLPGYSFPVPRSAIEMIRMGNPGAVAI
jgi:hypothetical protein